MVCARLGSANVSLATKKAAKRTSQPAIQDQDQNGSGGPKPLTVLRRGDKGLDHLRLHEVAAERVQLGEPEIEAGSVRISSQISEVLHCDESAVRLGGREGSILGYASEDAGTRRLIRRVGRRAKLGNGRVALCRRG